ncbi:hypothetical protein LCGC14_1264150 [marine sediment metagenome]|uniref:Uncharacterized protein n=1 Tax=marine sediment metagenome TaxID=412755 RepID=A0A0F9KZY0_9ZZZZ
MKNGDLTINCHTLTVSDKERNLLDQIRKVPYGEVIIFMRDGQPERIEKAVESVKL